MYLLKPYLAVFGALLLAASYFMVFKTDEAIIFYLGVLSATTEQGASRVLDRRISQAFPHRLTRALSSHTLSLARAFCVVCAKQRGPGSSPSTSRRGGA